MLYRFGYVIGVVRIVIIIVVLLLLLLVSPIQMEKSFLQHNVFGPLDVITETTRWARDAKGVYMDVWKLGVDKNMKSATARMDV